VSYLTQTALSQDPDFQSRVRGCCIQQANIFKDDARSDFVALANAIMRQENCQLTFFDLCAAAPDFDTIVDVGDGTIDSSRIEDESILSSVQALWPTVAGLYFNEDGTSIEG
jgi:hypothetical protein